MNHICSCAEFEANLSEYREGTLAPAAAAAIRSHLAGCPGCAALVEAVAEAVALVHELPELEPPPRLLAAIAAQTLPRRSAAARKAGGIGQLWATLTSPRFALGLAMSVFAFSLLLNAAQINLRQVMSGGGIGELSPASLTSTVQRKLVRTWARGVSYYRDLRVVYEIEAAVHQMRQNATPQPSQPGGHDHSQAAPAVRPDAVLAANPVLSSLLSRRNS